MTTWTYVSRPAADLLSLIILALKNNEHNSVWPKNVRFNVPLGAQQQATEVRHRLLCVFPIICLHGAVVIHYCRRSCFVCATQICFRDSHISRQQFPEVTQRWRMGPSVHPHGHIIPAFMRRGKSEIHSVESWYSHLVVSCYGFWGQRFETFVDASEKMCFILMPRAFTHPQLFPVYSR